jgi:hypothetical protein
MFSNVVGTPILPGQLIFCQFEVDPAKLPLKTQSSTASWRLITLIAGNLRNLENIWQFSMGELWPWRP